MIQEYTFHPLPLIHLSIHSTCVLSGFRVHIIYSSTLLGAIDPSVNKTNGVYEGRESTDEF